MNGEGLAADPWKDPGVVSAQLRQKTAASSCAPGRESSCAVDENAQTGGKPGARGAPVALSGFGRGHGRPGYPDQLCG